MKSTAAPQNASHSTSNSSQKCPACFTPPKNFACPFLPPGLVARLCAKLTATTTRAATPTNTLFLILFAHVQLRTAKASLPQFPVGPSLSVSSSSSASLEPGLSKIKRFARGGAGSGGAFWCHLRPANAPRRCLPVIFSWRRRQS